MNAAISGRAGTALIDDAGTLLRIDADAPDELLTASQHEYTYLFRDVQDIRYLTDTSIEAVRTELRSACNQEDAVHLLLIALDPETKGKTRHLAIDELEEVLADDEVHRHLERIFWSKPLPSSVNARVALAVADSRVRRFVSRLDDLQAVITRVRDAWRTVPAAYFRDYDRDIVYAFFAHAGWVRDVVTKTSTTATPERPKLDDFARQTGIPLSQIEGIWTSWIAAIAPRQRATTAMTLLTNTEQPSRVSRTFLERPTYFAAADAELEATYPVDFEASLAANLLFCHRVVIPQVMFFSSHGIRQHVESTHRSLLESAIEAGYVTIALHPDVSDFRSAHEQLFRKRIIDRCDALVARLQTAADVSYSPHVFEYMPREDSGHTFQLLLSMLPTKAPPAAALTAMHHRADLEHAWDETTRWRMEVIAPLLENWSRTKLRPSKEDVLQRLARAVAGRPRRVRTIADVLHDVEVSLRHGISIFWSWVSEAFRVDEAQRLQSIFHTPEYDRIQHIFTTAALGAMQDTPFSSTEIELPPQAALKRIPSALLLDLRRGPGEDYFRALQQLHRSPVDDRVRASVVRTLNTYATEINMRCSVYISEGSEVAQVRIGYDQASEIGRSRHSGLKFVAMTRFPSKIKHALRQTIGRFVGPAREPEVGPITTGDNTELSLHHDLADPIARGIS